jgi:hypothetical protein
MTGYGDERVRAVMTVDERLDDIKRSQIWARIEARTAGATAPRAWPRWVMPVGALAVAAVVVALARTRGGAGSQALVAPAGATLSTPLGPYARASLLGPAQLELLAVGEATSVRLHTGTLLAEFVGGSGRALRVEAPGLAVVVVGTLFAVEARDRGPTCVSVAHGRVRVERQRPSALVFVAAGERWCDGDQTASMISPATADALARHASADKIADAVRSAAPVPEVESLPPGVPTPTVASPTAALPLAAATPMPAPPEAAAAGAARSASLTPSHALPPAIHLPARSPTRQQAASPGDSAAESTPALSAADLAPVRPQPAASSTDASSTSRVDATGTSPPAPSPATATQPPAASADDMYATAEAALARGDRVSAERTLADLIATYPRSLVVGEALYERAQLAYRRHAYLVAQAALASIAGLAPGPLTEPAAYLACRIAVETHLRGARDCVISYRHSYPQSPHDLDVLGWLVEDAMREGGCPRAAPLVDELMRTYAASELSRAWQRRCPGAR